MSEIFNQNWNRERVRAGMRWFGPEDEVTIRNIQQTPGVTNIVTALHHIPAGEIWTESEVAKRKIEVEFRSHSDAPADLEGMKLYQWHQIHAERTGLVWDTAESLVFTEDIKNGSPDREKHIRNYKQSLQNLGRFGIINVVGNFMLVADWTRTSITALPDGSKTLKYIHPAFAAFDIYLLKRHDNEQDYVDDDSFTAAEVEEARQYWNQYLANDTERQQQLINMITAGLPGAQEGFTLDDFRAAVSKYEGMSVEVLQDHIAYFLDTVVPVANACGVRLCCHADDPAFSPFPGTPRAVGGSAGYKFLLDHGCGVNMCIGSLMANESNRDITAVIREIAEYGEMKGMSMEDIFPHIHLRPIETDGKNFREGHHAEHREELAKVVHTLVDLGWQGVFRPDHAPASDHGFGRPGYDVIGRGYGAQLLLGLFEMAEIVKATRAKAVKAAIKASKGDMTLKDKAIKAARKAEAKQIGKKIAFIKVPFVFGEQGVCASLD
ncbi:mannonate dehydratase [Pontiella sulfatireligans]|uniref:Mannonate dehydratase n=1 Tax=Pontiella sulfatireligans TaxID=2750658 RepID=A0A6C2UUR0_9BACT|nr:mannonate dehydratase [Pontiella sulfatireligans]VGO23111.1 Mannonate dehydratase [Pontiella sulfatireligans]